MTLTVEVTQADIDAANADKSRRGYCNFCPIWQAIQRHPQLKHFHVGSEYLYQNHRHEVKLPQEAAKFSQDVWAAFNQNSDTLWANVKPFTFQVEIKDESRS